MAKGHRTSWQHPSQACRNGPTIRYENKWSWYSENDLSIIKTAQTLYTPKTSFWVRWSMRKSDTIPRCQTGKTWTKEMQPCRRELSHMWPPPQRVLTTLLIIRISGLFSHRLACHPRFAAVSFSLIPGSSYEPGSVAYFRQALLPARGTRWGIQGALTSAQSHVLPSVFPFAWDPSIQ